MFKRILVAIDGSPASNAGFQWALDLAGDQQATLVTLNVVDDAVLPINVEGGIYPPSYVDTVMASIEKTGQKILDRAGAVARNRGVEIQPMLVRSRGNAVADVIVAQARKVKPDVIVLGTHGRRGLRRSSWAATRSRC
jgi:nucleotide-binding universal stress UspA family protein